jgi:hypothetical protein
VAPFAAKIVPLFPWKSSLALAIVRRLLFLPMLSITQQQKGLFFCFINGARFSNHFERRCQGKSDSGLDIYAQNGTLCAAIDNRRYRHV